MELHEVRIIQIVSDLPDGSEDKAIYESVADAKTRIDRGVLSNVEAAEIGEYDHNMRRIRVLSVFDGKNWHDKGA